MSGIALLNSEPRRPRRKPAPAPTVQEIPEWVTETPEPFTPFQLIAQESNGDVTQGIALSRDEYIACKAVVAKMRGYVAK